MPAFKKVYTVYPEIHRRESYRSGFYHPISILILALITLTVALAIFVNSGFFANKNVPTPSQTPQLSPKPSPKASPANETANWKTYKSKDNLYQLSYPGNWTVNDTNDVSMGYKAIDISIIEWNDGSKQYAEQQWQSVPCAPGSDGNGCAPLENKEIKKLSVGGNTVYWKIDGNEQMHALIPNSRANKTVEIYSGSLKDKNLFNQILSTFRFI